MATLEGMPSVQILPFPAEAYPKLSCDQLARAARYGIHRTYNSLTRLYRQGEREADLYIVLTGAIQTFWFDAVDREEHFITLESDEFSGELNLLNQRETLGAGR